MTGEEFEVDVRRGRGPGGDPAVDESVTGSGRQDHRKDGREDA